MNFKIKGWLVIMTLAGIMLSGCAVWTMNKDCVIWPDGSVTRIDVDGDGVVTAKRGDMEITADHRGRASIPEQILGVSASALVNGIQVEVGN